MYVTTSTGGLMLFRGFILFYPSLNDKQYGDLKDDFVALTKQHEGGLHTYATQREEDLPWVLANSLIALLVEGKVTLALRRSGLIDSGSVAFLETYFRFDGWLWARKREASTQLAKVIRELILQGRLEVTRDYPDMIFPQGNLLGHKVRIVPDNAWNIVE